MRRILGAVCVLGVGALAIHTTSTGPRAASEATVDALRFVRFEANRGQVNREVDFLARTPRFTAFLEGARAVFALTSVSSDAASAPATSYVALEFLGANGSVRPQAAERLAGYSNYLWGSDSSAWLRNVPHFARVEYQDLYPGIDLVYRGGATFEYDLIVRPGADPGRIRFRLDGASVLRITDAADLEAAFATGRLVHKAPKVYQERRGARSQVAGRFRLAGDNTASFELDAYDRTRAVTIDPVVIAYSTFVGGSAGIDGANAVAIDQNSMAYVVGETRSPDFPVKGGVQSTIRPDLQDAYVLKLDPKQQGAASLVYATYLGSTDRDAALDVEVNAQGEAFVAGYTHAGDFPVTTGGFKPTWTPNPNPADDESDAFVVVLNAQGNGLVYGTFFGGNVDDVAADIELYGNDVLYLGGDTHGSSFPVTPSAFDDTPQANATFLSVLDWRNNVLRYSTYYHANQFTYATGLAVGTSGLAHVTGIARTAGLPTKNGFLNTLPAGVSGSRGRLGSYYAVFDPSQSGNASLIYGTYLGAGDAEDVAVDSKGMGIVTGTSSWAAFPTTTGAYDTTCEDFIINGQNLGCARDAFVMKMDPTAIGPASLKFSTRLGGVRGEDGNAVLIDPDDNIYLTGSTSSSSFPAVDALPLVARPDGEGDAFVAKLNADGNALLFSTKLGGRTLPNGTLGAGDVGESIARSPDGGLVIAGSTDASDFPIHDGFDSSPGGSSDGFVAKLVQPADPWTVIVIVSILLLILLAFWKRVRNLVAGPVVPDLPGPGPR